MALLKTAQAAKFEDVNEGFVEGEGEGEVIDEAPKSGPSADERVAAAAARRAALTQEEKPVEAAPAATSKSTAVAPRAPGAVTKAESIMSKDPFTACDNAIKVEYNTLTRIMCTNGNFKLKEGSGASSLLGESIALEVISIQDHYVVSPGGKSEDKKAMEFLKFSDDGITTREGISVSEAVQQGKDAGYADTKLVHRTILVGSLIDPGKLANLKDELVQIDLAPRSKANFERHRMTLAFKIGKGLQTAENALLVRATAEVQSSKGNDWTDAKFSAYEKA